MRRIVLALAMTTGLAIGTVVPASALDTSVTLNCSDGTGMTLVVDAATLTSLTQSVQAMIDYPAGLTCTLLQTPVVRFFGDVALASTDQFVVGGGRYQLSCFSPGLGGQEARRDTTAPMVASSNQMKLNAGSSYQPLQTDDTMYWVNIAINDHQKDGSFVGTLNETIPDGQCVPHGHFTSKPTCLFIDGNTAYVTSVVTQTSGETGANNMPNFFKSGVVQDGANPSFLRFSFQDTGKPSTGIDDLLNGRLSATDPGCQQNNIGFLTPNKPLLNGNITVHS